MPNLQLLNDVRLLDAQARTIVPDDLAGDALDTLAATYSLTRNNNESDADFRKRLFQTVKASILNS